MAKYLKSLFTPSEKKSRTIVYEGDLEDGEPPMDSRRKLSISRSGRLKQANKKRHSLSKDLYGENYTPAERPKTMEYHVNQPVKPDITIDSNRRWSADAKVAEPTDEKSTNLNPTVVDRRPSTDARVLETEIDNAFEAIDKT
ncbi:uncharacterized protein LOC106130768 [Amyelois transitella]|uniref:uncharacterized protein LOC106130768 n=1 Tax=Amyelois transitella TaxID=680683 RepID=UPI00067BD7FC|nr:uncharacterized protein LOC106130768 [Amyelois transitella]